MALGYIPNFQRISTGVWVEYSSLRGKRLMFGALSLRDYTDKSYRNLGFGIKFLTFDVRELKFRCKFWYLRRY